VPHPKIALFAILKVGISTSESSHQCWKEPQAKNYLRIPSLPITAL
jgi:hypothetical protein